MRVLLIHSDYLNYTVKNKTPVAEEIEEAKKEGSFDDSLVVFTAVEKDDENNPEGIVNNLVKEVIKANDQVKAENIVLYPYAHLSSSLSSPKVAVQILKDAEEALLAENLTVKRVPFGWYKAFEISCKGHPLSELSRTITADEEEEKVERKPSTWQILEGDKITQIEDFNFDMDIKKSGEDKLKIRLTAKDGTDKFEGEFTLKQLIKENKVFSVFENIDEVIENLKIVIENEYLSLFLDMNYEFYFEFFIEINGKKRQVRLNLQPKNEDSKKKMALRIQEQTKQIEELSKQNQNLQKNYESLYNSIKHNYVIQTQNLNEIHYEAKNPNNLSIDSKIFKSEKEISFIKKNIANKIYKKLKQDFTLKLLYRATKDGDKAANFHKLCDGICPLVLLVKTMDEVRFGGFTQTYFESTNEYRGKRDDKAFIFSLDKMKTYNIEKGQNAILCFKNYGPVFYGNKFSNIFLSDNFFKTEGCVAEKGDRFLTDEDFEINNGVQVFKTKQVEVFQVILVDD